MISKGGGGDRETQEELKKSLGSCPEISSGSLGTQGMCSMCGPSHAIFQVSGSFSEKG